MLLSTASLAAALLAAAPVSVSGPPPSAAGGPEGRVAVGGWSFTAGAGDPSGRFAATRVAVPHVANPPTDDLRIAQARFRGGLGWYRTTVRVARRGRYALRFESVSHRADVWIDGVAVGTHAGAYRAFEVRPVLARGRHTIVVRADWRSPSAQSAAGWHRTWFNYGGIDREVTLRPLPAVADPAAAWTRTRLLPGGRSAAVTIYARVENMSGRARRIGVVAQLGRDGVPFALGPAPAAAGSGVTVRRTVRVPAGALWSPGRPVLHDLRVRVLGPGGGGWRGRVGLRELRWDSGRLRVNGVPLVLRGASLHEDAPGRGDALQPADMDQLVAQLRAIGANATRAQHPLSEALLERLDRAGVLVWQQVGPIDSPGEFRAGTSPVLLAEASRRVRGDVRAARRFASVGGYGLGVEVAYDGRPGQGSWVGENARWIHRNDPTRPVGLDVWGPRVPTPGSELVRDLDWVGMTNYLGWYEATFAPLPRVRTLLRHRVDGFVRRFGASKLVIVSEFGAEGSRMNARAARGGVGYQAALLGAHLAVYAREPQLDGVLVWALRDFAVNPAFGGGSIQARDRTIRFVRGLNQKGLFDREGRAKPAVGVVRRGLARLGG